MLKSREIQGIVWRRMSEKNLLGWEVSDLSGINLNTVHALLTKKDYNPRLDTLNRVLDVLGLELKIVDDGGDNEQEVEK